MHHRLRRRPTVCNPIVFLFACFAAACKWCFRGSFSSSLINTQPEPVCLMVTRHSLGIVSQVKREGKAFHFQLHRVLYFNAGRWFYVQLCQVFDQFSPIFCCFSTFSIFGPFSPYSVVCSTVLCMYVHYTHILVNSSTPPLFI